MATKKNTKVRDLKPSKDAKGGGPGHVTQGSGPGHQVQGGGPKNVQGHGHRHNIN